MLEDYLPEFQDYFMDAKIKKILKTEENAINKTKNLLKADKKQDRKLEKLEKEHKMKKK